MMSFDYKAHNYRGGGFTVGKWSCCVAKRRRPVKDPKRWNGLRVVLGRA